RLLVSSLLSSDPVLRSRPVDAPVFRGPATRGHAFRLIVMVQVAAALLLGALQPAAAIAASHGVAVTPTSGLQTTEAGGAATFTVRLTSQPGGTVTITLASNRPGEGVATPSTLTFTNSNWDVAQTVTVTGVDDRVDDGNQPYTVVLNPAVSSKTQYNGI